ncbi:uncharacterized protein LOC135496094 isoform X2 [Lineus longissimus]|uniref:uncharacterized protein LOC135496094 isoform X2 n=1 Tax=Lineus longissimus TaxID=88925 RepID=UPI002B4E0C83
MDFYNICCTFLSLLVVFGIEFRTTRTVTINTDCGIEVQKSTSLNYGYIDWDGANYNGSINCSYVIALAPWERVRLTFLKFRLPSTTQNCTSGYLQVGTSGEMGARLCSERDVALPRTRVIRGKSAWVSYYSSAAENDAFMIKYEVENETACDRTLTLGSSASTANLPILSSHDNPRNTSCTIRLVAPHGQLIRLSFRQGARSVSNSFSKESQQGLTIPGILDGNSASCKAAKGIIRFGNHLDRMSDNFPSSFRLCKDFVPLEYVSRGNTLWIDFRENSAFNETNLSIEYEVLPKVTCTDQQFKCSAVQCVDKARVCDGKVNCKNGLDEYCDHDRKSPGCFLCEDGNCIGPKKPFYAFDADKPLWWLCDGYSHCNDGTDERADVCRRLRGRHDSLFYCQPKTARNRGNYTVAILKRFLCDGIEHCYNGEDERHPSCQKKKGKSHFRAEWVYVPLAAFALLTLGIATIYFSGKSSKRRSGENGDYLVPSVVVNSADDGEESESEHLEGSAEETQRTTGKCGKAGKKKTWLNRFMSRPPTIQQIETAT